jgi:hypothetical protein
VTTSPAFSAGKSSSPNTPQPTWMGPSSFPQLTTRSHQMEGAEREYFFLIALGQRLPSLQHFTTFALQDDACSGNFPGNRQRRSRSPPPLHRAALAPSITDCVLNTGCLMKSFRRVTTGGAKPTFRTQSACDWKALTDDTRRESSKFVASAQQQRRSCQ